jgi:NAD(P)-dependent dehydrogenase (short-subunit alcohol dehydrogenase family)
MDRERIAYDFTGRVVVVTGGRGALGSSIVDAFAAAGAKVAVPVRGTDLSRSEAVQFQGRARLDDETESSAFFESVKSNLGETDILVNAAGGYAGGPEVEETPVADIFDLFNKNFMTAFLSCRNVLPSMKKRKFGRIINIAAMTGLSPAAKKLSYSVSKRAVITLTEVLALECAGTGVTCNAIAPAIIETPANLISMSEGERSRWTTPREIASLTAYLASGEGGAMNGNTIKLPLR